jgi:hypothetical protein
MLSFPDKISLSALGVAIISLLFSFISYRVSLKTFRLTKREHLDKYLNIKPYLINALKWSSDEEDYISFAISYTNEATTANSLRIIELQLDFYDADNLLKTAKIDPVFDISPVNLKDEYKALALPVKLSDKETQSGWVTFKLSKNIWNDFTINVYRVNAITAANTSVVVETHLVNEVSYED